MLPLMMGGEKGREVGGGREEEGGRRALQTGMVVTDMDGGGQEGGGELYALKDNCRNYKPKK